MIHAWGITDKGAVRTQNQDGYYLDVPSEHLAVGVVCDGMGGAKAGNVASLVAVETFVDALKEMGSQEESRPAAVLAQAAETANSAVFHRAATDPDCRGMGTTMVAALVVERMAYLLNIGDSRAYHVNDQGIARLTRDHSVVEDMVARGDITPEEARNHPRKNLITRALGPDISADCDGYICPMQPGEYLLLCSDGLVNTVTDQEMLFEVIHGDGPDTCLDRLLAIARRQGAPDNVTAVLMRKQ